ncbi:uncharacterized protein [Dermacentor andersoni]|uniref:uncharacterized protein n=1 Tax=Dermacentor andersoni TaxID=34620 RepID=UPI003B3B2401
MALATNLGTPRFDENQDKWDIYLTRLEVFFEANDIKTDDKKRALLVSMLSTKTVGVLAGQCAPQKVNALSYKDALTILNNHYAPKTNEVAASYEFFTRDQAASESVRDYVVELRKLADNCHFGASLDRLLRDRIVCGIRNRAVQQTLLDKTELTLAQAETIAISAETAALEVSAMTRLDNEAAVCTVASKSRRYQTFTKDKQSHTECARCGNYDHEASDCLHKKEQCFRCRKTGHFARKCRSQSGLRAGRRRDGVANAVHYESAVSETEEGDISSVFTLQESREKKSMLQAFRRVIRWGGVPMNMITDTGSPFSIIPQEVYLKHRLSWPRLSKCKRTLNCYLGKLPIVGELHLEANFAGKTVPATLIVTGCSGPSLCGRDLIQAFSLLPSGFLAAVQSTSADPDSLRTEFPALFEPGLGNIQGPPVKFHIREGAQPKFHKARSIPYALREKVETELDRLVDQGILSPIAHSEWAAPIVPVLKKDGSLRICGDFKITINAACITDQYPLPNIEDIFASLRGGSFFTTLDLKDAYNQLPLDEEARKLAVINTHKGLFCYNRLPFGVASAPAIFQRRMETVLAGLPAVQVYLDDVLIAERQGDNGSVLRDVLRRLQENGIKLKAEKCHFRKDSIVYLGHRIDKDCLHPLEKNLAAIRDSPRPTNPPRFQSGDQVWVRNFGQGERWRPGIVKSIEGSRLVTVGTPDGLARRHFDQIFRRVPVSPVTPKAEASDSLQPSSDNKHRPTSTPEARCSLATPGASGAAPVPSTTPPTSSNDRFQCYVDMGESTTVCDGALINFVVCPSHSEASEAQKSHNASLDLALYGPVLVLHKAIPLLSRSAVEHVENAVKGQYKELSTYTLPPMPIDVAAHL